MANDEHAINGLPGGTTKIVSALFPNGSTNVRAGVSIIGSQGADVDANKINPSVIGKNDSGSTVKKVNPSLIGRNDSGTKRAGVSFIGTPGTMVSDADFMDGAYGPDFDEPDNDTKEPG